MSQRVYIGQLPPEISEREVEDAFGRYGRLRNVWIARKPPGFAFVEFEDSRDAQDAVAKLDGHQGWRVEFSRGPGGGGGGRGGFGGGRGGFDGGRGGFGGGRGEIRCYECGELGHIARDCRSYGRGGGGGGGGGGYRGRSPPRRRSPSPGGRRRSPSPGGRRRSPSPGARRRSLSRDRGSPPRRERSPRRERERSPRDRSPRDRSPPRGDDRDDRGRSPPRD